MTEALWRLPATELAALIDERAISSVQVVDACLDQLDRLEPDLNAFVTVTADAARAAAEAADAEIAQGRYRGPLHGVPVSLKDLFFTAGLRTTGGSKTRVNWVPEYDSTLVARLKAAGAVLLGKNNLDEFGHGGTSTVSYFGPVHNPWDLDRVAGGSSGGSAAAVAAGIGPLSYGTETASSVRRPATFCGVVGVKPTFGIISRHGSFRTAWSLDHAGVFARTVEDAAIGIDAVAGYDPQDPASVPSPAGSYFAGLQASVGGRTIAILPRFLDDESVQPDIRAAFDRSLELLRHLGATIHEVEIPELAVLGDDVDADKRGRDVGERSGLDPRADP